MKSVEFHPEAQDELVSAANFYERQTEGLGLDFILMVQRTYERIQESPAIGPRFGRHLRRLLVPKFPYGLLYRIEPERIYIVAVMHLRLKRLHFSDAGRRASCRSCSLGAIRNGSGH